MRLRLRHRHLIRLPLGHDAVSQAFKGLRTKQLADTWYLHNATIPECIIHTMCSMHGHTARFLRLLTRPNLIKVPPSPPIPANILSCAIAQLSFHKPADALGIIAGGGRRISRAT
jgi:hypothetical protein